MPSKRKALEISIVGGTAALAIAYSLYKIYQQEIQISRQLREMRSDLRRKEKLGKKNEKVRKRLNELVQGYKKEFGVNLEKKQQS